MLGRPIDLSPSQERHRSWWARAGPSKQSKDDAVPTSTLGALPTSSLLTEAIFKQSIGVA